MIRSVGNHPILDGIATVFPAVAAKMMTSRIRYEYLKRHFEGASFKRHRDFKRNTGSANVNLSKAHGSLVSNARYVHDNNATARRGIDIITKYTSGITPHAVRLTGQKSDKHEARLKEFADTVACDPAQKLNLYAQQSLAVRTIVRDGEVLIQKVIRPDWKEKGLPVPIQTRVLECDYLDKNKTSVSNQGNPIIMGVEFDKYGTPIKYHMYDEHPGESRSIKNYDSRPLDAENIIHAFDVERAGQVRGVTKLAPVLVRLRDLDEYEDAQLIKQKIASCFVGVVEDINSELMDQPTKEDQDEEFNRILTEWSPGKILHGISGKHINFNTPPSVDSFKDTTPEYKRSIAAGLGVPYMALACDYGRANYTSSRMEFLDFYKMIDHFQENVLIPQICHRIFSWFLEGCELIGLSSKGVQGIWTPPKKLLIEPLRDVQGTILSIQSGLISHAEGVRSLGFDPFDVYDEIATVMDYLKKKNIDFNFASKPKLNFTNGGAGE